MFVRAILSQGHVCAFDFLFALRSSLSLNVMFIPHVFLFYFAVGYGAIVISY